MTATTRRALLGAAILPALPAAAQGNTLHVEQPWTRAAGQGGQGAGYMTLRNAGPQPDRLLSAESPAAQRVELHTHIRDGEVMRMRPVADIPVPAGGSTVLQSGGLHLMLIGLTRPLAVGEAVPVTLRFERAGTVTVNLAVQAAGARGPAGHGHGHGHR